MRMGDGIDGTVYYLSVLVLVLPNRHQHMQDDEVWYQLEPPNPGYPNEKRLWTNMSWLVSFIRPPAATQPLVGEHEQ